MSKAPPLAVMPTAVMTTSTAATVSRLPKFKSATLTPAACANSAANANPSSETMGQASTVINGLAVSANNNSRLNNGFYQHFGQSSGVKNNQIQANGKPNGFIRAPTNFATKWRKENVEDASTDFEFKSGKTVKKMPNNFTGKTRSLNQIVASVSSPKVVPKLAMSKITQKASLNCLAKKQQNGMSSLPKSASQNSSFLPKASSKSSDVNKKQAASRSLSSDSIGASQNVSLTTSHKIRSQSLTQVRRQPSPQNLTKSRAYSTNRVVRKATNTAAAMLPTTMIKKPLMVSYGARQNGGAGFRMRAGVFKEAGPVRVQNVEVKRSQRRNSVETSSDSPGSTPEAPDSRGPSERGSQNEMSMLGETLEDMSLSSTSSLDHHETSQEYMDDFDNLGNGGVGVLDEDQDSGLDQSRFHDDDERLGVSTATELCFLDDGLDWNHLRISDRDPRLHKLSRRRRSSQPDYHSQCGSSLDLSPSDSCGSGGTFLWDEEVEPLGGTLPIPVQSPVQSSVRSNGLVQNGFHQIQNKPVLDRSNSLHVGSLHSDISSVDALNELESCDLDEDDLMLDVDFTEDGSLTSDAGGSSHMAEWRRRQLCWGTQDVHNDNESDFQPDTLNEGQKKNERRDSQLSLDLCLNSLKTSPGLGVDVEELVDDCSAVRSQLEYLQRILMQDDDADEDTLTTDTLSPESTDTSSDGTETQVEVLLQEVLQLREELRSRDRTIAQLTQQLSVAAVTSRCRCQDTEKTDVQTQTRDRQTENVGSQTTWTDNTPPLLQPNQSSLQDPLINSSKPCSAQSASTSSSVAPPPGPPVDHMTPLDAATEDHGKRRGRSLQLPQPSKLRLFMFANSSNASSPATKKKLAENNSPGTKMKNITSTPSLSRLPKPKTY